MRRSRVHRRADSSREVLEAIRRNGADHSPVANAEHAGLSRGANAVPDRESGATGRAIAVEPVRV